MMWSAIHLVGKCRALILPCLSEKSGMDQENAAGEEELAVLALYKMIQQYTGR